MTFSHWLGFSPTLPTLPPSPPLPGRFNFQLLMRDLLRDTQIPGLKGDDSLMLLMLILDRAAPGYSRLGSIRGFYSFHQELEPFFFLAVIVIPLRLRRVKSLN